MAFGQSVLRHSIASSTVRDSWTAARCIRRGAILSDIPKGVDRSPASVITRILSMMCEALANVGLTVNEKDGSGTEEFESSRRSLFIIT